MKKIQISALTNTTTIGATDKMTILTQNGFNLATIEALRKMINGEGIYSGDLNELLKSGVYLAVMGATNLPVGATGGVLICFNPIAISWNRILQVFVQHSSTTTRIYMRYRSDSGFNPWREVAFV